MGGCSQLQVMIGLDNHHDARDLRDLQLHSMVARAWPSLL